MNREDGERCRFCGGEIPVLQMIAAETRGQKPTYCSPKHRAADHNARSYRRRRGEESGHDAVDRRSLAFHRLIATKIEAEPDLVNVASRNIDRWRHQGRTERYLKEWEGVLRGGADEVVRVLRSTGQRATRLRQSSPFVGILAKEERDGILRAYRP
jgi:hypothetical protein